MVSIKPEVLQMGLFHNFYLLHKNYEIISRSLYHSTVPLLAMICRSIAEYPPVIKVNYCETGILEIRNSMKKMLLKEFNHY
jgi:hypothetical protein